MNCGVLRICGSDLVLLWLWCRPAAVAPIQPLAWNIHMLPVQPLKAKKKKSLIFFKKGYTSYQILILIKTCLYLVNSSKDLYLKALSLIAINDGLSDNGYKCQ